MSKTYAEAMREAQREYLTAEHDYFLALMTEHNWHHVSAARAAGLNRTHMYRMLQRAGVAKPPAQRVTTQAMTTTRLLQRLAVHR